MDEINLEAIANQILEAVDYDIYKEDVEFGNGTIRDEIESVLEALVKDIQTICE
ncbi:hypothetical protein NVP1121O_196 [Vibrio phage 1.121.O._10N.286.46.C4]|nr:hypothetical protein NVP1121O_196 [Vibrio phage 1.121.O._10N.286.46.C4]